ncbi:MAG: hypothetical protein EOO74_04150 [Myxococcales bacterium]|nr:MAG: hypothetical protein EOO74_04150 [Myxococcales bacterium]
MSETNDTFTKWTETNSIARQILGEMFADQTKASTVQGVANRVQMLRRQHSHIIMQSIDHEEHIFLVLPDHGLVSSLVREAVVSRLRVDTLEIFPDGQGSTLYLLPFDRFYQNFHDALPHASDYRASKEWTRPIVCVDEVGITVAEADQLGVYPSDVAHLVDLGDVRDSTNWVNDPHAVASKLSILEDDLRQATHGEIGKLARKHLRKAMKLIEAGYRSANPASDGGE